MRAMSSRASSPSASRSSTTYLAVFQKRTGLFGVAESSRKSRRKRRRKRPRYRHALWPSWLRADSRAAAAERPFAELAAAELPPSVERQIEVRCFRTPASISLELHMKFASVLSHNFYLLRRHGKWSPAAFRLQLLQVQLKPSPQPSHDEFKAREL